MVETNFKHTDIGLIPHDWEVQALSEVVDVFDGTHQTPTYVNHGVNFYSVENITNNEFVHTKFISEEEHKYLTRKRCIEKGDVLMTRIGSIGECKYIDWDVRASYYVSLALLKNKDKEHFSMQYLAYASESSAFKESVKLNSLQFAIPLKINLGEISKVQLLLPPTLAEQERIANAIGKIDELLAAMDEQIAKKCHIKQGVMQHLLTGKSRLKGFSGEWNVTTLGKVTGSIQRGQSLQSKDFIFGYIPVVAGGKQYAGFHKYASHKGRTITVSGSGANAGYVWLHNEPIFATDCSVIVENGTFSLDYIYYYLSLRQGDIYKKQTGGAQPHIYPKDLEKFEIRIPNSINEQEAIAEALLVMDEEIHALQEERDKYALIKQGMMQQLLTGKIRI